MKIRNFIKPLIVCGVISMAFIGCDKDKDEPDAPKGGGGSGGTYSGSVMEKIDLTEGLDSFRVAVKYIGLDEKLISNSNLTVFAPSNEAFGYFLDRRGASHVTALSKEVLESALNYHVGTSIIKSANFSGTQYINTLDETGPNGNSVMIQLVTNNGTTKVLGKHAMSKTDISGSNGVVHVVGDIFVKPTVRDFILYDTRLGQLRIPFTKDPPGFDAQFGKDNGEAFTFFAPTNEGFDNFIRINPLYNSVEGIDAIHIPAVLNIHVLGGLSKPMNLRTEDMQDNPVVETWQGTSGNLKFHVSGGNVTIETPNYSQQNIKIIDKDLQAKNGVVHIIDDVITNQ